MLWFNPQTQFIHLPVYEKTEKPRRLPHLRRLVKATTQKSACSTCSLYLYPQDRSLIKVLTAIEDSKDFFPVG